MSDIVTYPRHPPWEKPKDARQAAAWRRAGLGLMGILTRLKECPACYSALPVVETILGTGLYGEPNADYECTACGATFQVRNSHIEGSHITPRRKTPKRDKPGRPPSPEVDDLVKKEGISREAARMRLHRQRKALRN